MAESKSSYWFQFFKNSGIPENICLQYSRLFAEHRIQKNQLVDFNKTLLNEIGITAVGDVLAILKFAQKEAEKFSYEKLGILEKQIEKAKKSILKKESVTSPEKIDAPLQRKDENRLIPNDVEFVAGSPKKLKIDTPSVQTSVFQRGLKFVETAQHKSNIFDRLGGNRSPNSLAKVTFTSDTKSEARTTSDEVTSTTDERDTFQSLESDRILLKQVKSPMASRIGLKMTISNTESAGRIFSCDPADYSEARIGIKSRLGPTLNTVDDDNNDAKTSSVFKRLGKRPKLE